MDFLTHIAIPVMRLCISSGLTARSGGEVVRWLRLFAFLPCSVPVFPDDLTRADIHGGNPRRLRGSSDCVSGARRSYGNQHAVLWGIRSHDPPDVTTRRLDLLDAQLLLFHQSSNDLGIGGGRLHGGPRTLCGLGL